MAGIIPLAQGTRQGPARALVRHRTRGLNGQSCLTQPCSLSYTLSPKRANHTRARGGRHWRTPTFVGVRRACPSTRLEESSMEIRNPLPADIEAARRLLAANGWEQQVSNPERFAQLIANSQRVA